MRKIFCNSFVLFCGMFVSFAVEAAPNLDSWDGAMRLKALASACVKMESVKSKEVPDFLAAYNRFIQKNISSLITLRKHWVQEHGEESAATLATEVSDFTEPSIDSKCTELYTFLNEGLPKISKVLASTEPPLRSKIVSAGPSNDQVNAEVKATSSSEGGGLTSPSPEPVYFIYASAKPDARSVERIRAVATMLRNQPTLFVNLIGHTSADGTLKGDAYWSLVRAEVVANALRSEGISPERIKVTSEGSKYAKTSREAPEALRALDRKVEFKLSKATAQPF